MTGAAVAEGTTQPPPSEHEVFEEEFGVLVGWAHAPFSRGIQLKLQTRRGEDDVAQRQYLMTRNQALILAKYLLDATGQSLPAAPREGALRRLVRRITGG